MFKQKSNTPNITLPVIEPAKPILNEKQLLIYVREDELESTKKTVTLSGVGDKAKAEEDVYGLLDNVSHKKAKGYFRSGKLGAMVSIKSNISKMIDSSNETLNNVQIRFENTSNDKKTAYINFIYSDIDDKRMGILGNSMINSTSAGLADVYLNNKASVERVTTKEGAPVLLIALTCQPDAGCPNNECGCGFEYGVGVLCASSCT